MVVMVIHGGGDGANVGFGTCNCNAGAAHDYSDEDKLWVGRHKDY